MMMLTTGARLLTTIVSALLITIINGNGQTRSKDQMGASSPRLSIIDSHTHTSFTGKPEPTSGIPVSREQYFKEWQRAGIIGGVSHSNADGEMTADLRNQNVITCVGVNEGSDIGLIEDGLKSGRFGCIKIYLGYVHRYANDKNYEPIYALAEKYDVAVVFHTGDTYSATAKLKFADPLTIDEVAVDHPKVRFVIAHCGNPWIQSAAEVAYKNPNVFLDGSALLIGNLNAMPRRKVDEYVVKPLSWVFGYLENPAKLMFGSDWPLTDIESYVTAFKRAIPREHWKAVFHDNAARVFKFKVGSKPAARTRR
jgi:hypothetical protein